jgi:hypothetical protein
LNDKVVELGLNDSINVQWIGVDDDSEDNLNTVGIQNEHRPFDVYGYLYTKGYLRINDSMEKDPGFLTIEKVDQELIA